MVSPENSDNAIESTAPPVDGRETDEAYWARKRAELRLLGSRIVGGGAPAPRDPDTIATVADLFAEKQALRARLLGQALAAAPQYTESSFTWDRVFPLSTGRASYSYQRYNLIFRHKPFWDYVYAPSGQKGLLSTGILTGSGMAAVTSALSAIDRTVPDPRKLIISPSSYFETLFFIHKYLRALAPALDLFHTPFSGNVLYLDSYAQRNPYAPLQRASFAHLAYVVCDTTCWDAGDPLIARLAAHCLDDGVPLILVRSHIKLDQLGVEYWRLGSVVIVFSRAFGTARIRELKELRQKMLSFLTLGGGNFFPHAPFPLAGDPEFIRLNSTRNRVLMRNNHEAAKRLKRLLSDSLTRVKEQHHGCFLRVEPILDIRTAVDENLNQMIAALRAAGLDMRHAPSFAYDFFAASRVGPQSGPGSALRVCVPDGPPSQLDTFVRAAARFAHPLSVY